MTEKAYKAFCGDLAKNFNIDWAKHVSKLDFAFRFLEHIPEIAWKPMVQIAVNRWDGWPRNWTKAIKEVYRLYQRDAQIERAVTDCEYCNGNGFFSGVKHAEIKPGVFSKYSYTWRCAGCRNWFGVLGDKIPKSFPLEIKSQGFKIELYGKPMPKSAERKDLLGMLESVGQRVNPKTDRPEYMPYREPGEDG